jgi:prephenate dehydrogenase
MINQLTIIGLHGIGKSIAAAIRQSDFTKSIVGYEQGNDELPAMAAERLIDHHPIDLATAVKNSDLIVITTPYAHYEDLLSNLAPLLKKDVIITDTNSIKEPGIQLAKEILGKHFHNFVPSHPIVGFTEDYCCPSKADLFANRPIIITPSETTCQRAFEMVTQFWQKMGGEIEVMTASENDEILASFCHLPQLLALTFINSIKSKDSNLRYISKNFKEFTSIATNNPVLWRDLCITNRQAILREISKFEKDLDIIKKILEGEETEVLLEHFNEAKLLRESL